MAMSKDRIVFFLPRRYYLHDVVGARKSFNGLRVNDCIILLQFCFGAEVGELHQVMRNNPDGFYIRCRPSQFARFIVKRMELLETTTGGSNGIRDLNPRIEKGKATLGEIAGLLGLSPTGAQQVLTRLGMTATEVRERVENKRLKQSGSVSIDLLDFSRNPAQLQLDDDEL